MGVPLYVSILFDDCIGTGNRWLDRYLANQSQFTHL